MGFASEIDPFLPKGCISGERIEVTLLMGERMMSCKRAKPPPPKVDFARFPAPSKCGGGTNTLPPPQPLTVRRCPRRNPSLQALPSPQTTQCDYVVFIYLKYARRQNVNLRVRIFFALSCTVIPIYQVALLSIYNRYDEYNVTISCSFHNLI